MDALTVDLIGLRYKVQAVRIVKRIERESGMAIDVSGLKAKALKARANWDRLHAAYDKFNELKMDALTARDNLDRIKAAYAKFNDIAPAHAIDVEGLAEQVSTMQSDLEFAAGLLGNSPPLGQELPVDKSPPQGPFTGTATATSVIHMTDTQTFVDGQPVVPTPSPVMSHAPMARAVPSRRDL
jgi:hypothetical protein